MNALALLTQCNNRLEAEMIQALLTSAGIKSFVTADDAGGLYGMRFALTAAGSAQVQVTESDLKAAREIIQSNPPTTSEK